MSSSHSALQSKATNPCLDKLRYIMLLAPFQPATRIELETNVNTSAECYLDIKNTGDKTLNVTITKVPAAERQIALSLSQLEVQGKSNGTICIKWSPKETGCWRDVLQLTDNRRIKYDIIIATTAKDNKKSFHKTKRRLPKQSSSLLKPSNFSMSTTNKQFCQSNTLLKVPTIGPPLIPKLDVQAKQSKLRHENDLNKENIFNRFDETETYATRGRDDRISGTYHNHDKPDNVIFEQNINVWNSESILPQVLFSTNEPQDIRRVTYVKEKKPCSSILHEHNEITEDTTCDNDKVHSEISILLNKFTFTPVAVTSNSPELAESTSFSQSADKHTTFNISHSHLFETSATYDTKTFNNAPPISQPAGLQHLSPIKSDGCSLITDMKDLIASSPIAQQHNMTKNSNEYLKNLMVEPSIQITNREYFSFEIIPENIEASKKIGDMYIEISPPKKHFHSQIVSMSIPKLNSTRTGRITKNKTLYEGGSGKKLQLNLPVAKRSTKNVAAIKINKLSLSDLSKTKWHTSSFIRESRFGMQNKEHSFLYEPLDPFAASTTEDPFLKNNSTVHYDEQWLLQQELAFTKWLNALLSSPEDLSVDIETAVTDIGKVWQSCKAQRNTVLAETKEAVSARYHTSVRLNTLRKAASAMFKSNEITQVLSRTDMYIIKGTLCIRSDRNLHRDIGLQKIILALFLNYNPLWLRIGLETVYSENIPLRSNNDIIGLTRFLLTRFFSDPQLTKMPGYHKTDPSQKIVTKLNQFILKKFLYLIYFLDYAKQHKLIGHDPCLFHKRAQHKESREILLSFSRELLSGIGDVTRVLRIQDYILTHRQTYIEEYDYAVTDIRCDLRDGVRLCRVMELITGVRELTQRCRAPAISRLQKVYNVDLALNALRQAGYILEGDIDPKSIADGHCEKTLSLLWQIIHKYQAPRFDRAARVIQRWWRAQLWYVRVRNFLRARRNRAAVIIQRAWRRKMTPSWNCDLKERRYYLCVRTATIHIQRWWRNVRETRKEKLRELRNIRETVIRLQKRWRAVLLMRTQRDQYRNLRNAALMIQKRWRATRAMKLQRSKYLAYIDAAVRVQYWWRSTKIMRKQREWFLRRRESACIIQIFCRRWLLARKARNDFLRTRTAVRCIERWWINLLDRKKFLMRQKSAVLIQRTWRKYRTLKQEAASLKIQTWWRATMYSRRYKLQKSCCIKLQRWWRGIQLTRHQRAEFLQVREAALIVQKNWRAKMVRRHYLKQRRATLLIQSWCRCVNSAKSVRRRYLKMRDAAIRTQNWWRNVAVARQERKRYLRLRETTVLLQTHWRRRVLARADRQRYLTKKKACVTLQSWWRMIKARREYQRYKICVLNVQRRWRATRVARPVRREYLLTRAAIVLQTRWRALAARRRFVALRRATRAATVIQSYYRMRIAVRRYETVKYATLIIQTYWRAYVAGRRERLRYLILRRTVITLQRRYIQRKIEREELRRQWQDDIATKIRNECGEAMQMHLQDTTRLAIPDSDYWKEMIVNLRNCDNVGTLIACLNSLDIVTKLSPTVCIILCELNLADDIYNTIAQNNRSVPWMKVCLRACSILITLTKHNYTRKYILKNKYALVLMKLLNGSLKNKEIFLHCATLIWLLSQNEDYSKAMMACPQINWFIKNIQQKILKDDIVTKLQKLKDMEKLYPSCEPDRRNTHKPRLFTDMDIAIAAIVKKI